MNLFKKLLFTLIYPLWFFLARTWLGGVFMICFIPMTPAFILFYVLPDLFTLTGEEAEGLGGGIAIISILISPFIAIPFMALSGYLETHYEEWNYKTEMETKMI